MIRTVLLTALALIALASNAEARQRHKAYVADPGCNVIFPCEGVVASPRGQIIADKMKFGAPQQVYTPRVSDAHRHETGTLATKPPFNRSQIAETGVVKSSSGATAHVAPHATGAFQCLVTALEGTGYPVRFMGGWRARGSVRGSLHPAGLALDVNQVARNVTTPRMPANEIALANSCGLISGAQWANGDSGHFQLGGWSGGRTRYVHRHHHRYASAL